MSADNLPVSTPAAWLKYAEGDLRVAKAGMRSKDPAYATICFLCQGSGEKFLKAFLIANGWELEKTHDVKKLLKYCQNFNPAFARLEADAETLNTYITAGRYPGFFDQESITRAEAQEAVKAANKIRLLVKKLQAVPQDGQPGLLPS